MNRKLLLAILVSISAAFMAACGSGNSSNPVEIAFNQAPPADLQIGAMAPISATVVNSTNTGVNWTVTCGSAACGSFSSASGVSTTYTAPAAVPSGNTVTITATASADSSVSVTATITITASTTGSALNGQYAFLVSGMDGSGNYAAAGSVTADGNGNITTGEEDFCDLSAVACSTALLRGTYSTGSDGRGSINIQSTALGTQTLEIVVTSSSHALVVEFDSGATASGTLDLQDPTALSASAISGGYSVALNGIDLSQGLAAALGGIMTGDGSGGFTNVTFDENDGGVFSTESTAFGNVSPPDSSGRTVVSDGSFEFVYYIVNTKALRFVESDLTFFLTSGSAYTEGTGTLGVTNLAGSSIFNEAGASAMGFLGVAGEAAVDNSGNVTGGFMDVNDNGSISNGSISGSTFANFASARGTFTLAGNVSSDVTVFQVYLVDPGVNILDPNNSTGGGGALLLDSDQNAAGIGAIIPQAASPQFNGNYGVNLQAFESSNGGFIENDLEGQVAASSSANLNGTGDLNNFGNLMPAQTLTGSFMADSTNPGRFTGSLTVGSFGTFNLVYYQATNSQLVLVEVDKGQIGSGTLVAQQ